MNPEPLHELVWVKGCIIQPRKRDYRGAMIQFSEAVSMLVEPLPCSENEIKDAIALSARGVAR
jgi:hypothetical protein